MFKKQINFQQVYSSRDFSDFNLQNYITILEDLTHYNFPFTRIKQVEKELEEAAGDDEEEKKTEEIVEEENEDDQEEEEKKTEEITEDKAVSDAASDAASATTAATEESKTAAAQQKIQTKANEMVEKLKQPGKSINLEDIEEGDLGESHVQEGERQVL